MQICNNHYDAQLDSRSQKDGGSDGVRFLKSTSVSVNKTLSFRQTANLLNNNCIASLGVCVCVCVRVHLLISKHFYFSLLAAPLL